MKLPEYVKCVMTGMANSSESWCGRRVSMEWAFVDATHALLNARQGQRLLICPKCSKAMAEALKKGTFTK